MNILITPSCLSGNVSAPPSKSITHRALILASLANGTSNLKNILICEDTLCTINALKSLGVKIEISDNNAKVSGKNGSFSPKSAIDVKNSGTTYRFLTALGALSGKKLKIKGSSRIKKRPINELLKSLKLLETKSNIMVDSAKSSQFLSALLLISPLLKKELVFESKNLSSSPYIDITLFLMQKFGVKVTAKNGSYFVVPNQKYHSTNYEIEGDYSSAAFFFAGSAITKSKINILDLNPDSVQGDRYFLDIVKKMTIKNQNLAGIKIDMKNYPDLVPVLSVLAAFAKGKTLITGISHLRLKESDRISSVAKGLIIMGIKVKQTGGSLEITGGMPKGASIDTHNDHRIAMSFAIAALNAKGNSLIKNAEVVNKSYPEFWNDLINYGLILSGFDSYFKEVYKND